VPKGLSRSRSFLWGCSQRCRTSDSRTSVWIQTPDQAFGEYDVEALVPSTGKTYRQTYAGRLVAEKGKIALLREVLDTKAASLAFSKD
jgi:hypothetical protein